MNDDKALGLLTQLVDSQKDTSNEVKKLGNSMFGMQSTQKSHGEQLEQISSSLFTGPDAIKSKVDVHAQEIENLKASKRSLSPLPLKNGISSKTLGAFFAVLLAVLLLAAQALKSGH